MKWYRILFSSVFVLMMVSSCQKKLEDKDIPEVDKVMLDSSEPKLNKLNEVIEEEPENPLLYFKRAKIYYELQNLDKAQNDINQAIQLDNTQGKFYHLQALILNSQEKTTLAVKAAEKALALGSKEAGLYIIITQLYQKIGDEEKADYYLSRAQAIGPFHSEVIYLNALKSLKAGDSAAALRGFKEAIKRAPEFSEPYYQIADIFESRRKDDSALVYIMKGFKSAQDKSGLYFVNGKVLERLGLRDASLYSYETSAALDSTFFPVYAKLGDIYLAEGDKDKAISYYANYIKYNFSDKRANLILAELYQKTGNGRKAIPIYEQVLVRDSSDLIAKEALKVLYAKYGDKTKPYVKADTTVIEKTAPIPVKKDVVPVKKDTVIRKPEPVNTAPKPVVKKQKVDSIRVAPPKGDTSKVRIPEPVIDTAPVAPKVPLTDPVETEPEPEEKGRKRKKNKKQEE